MNRLELKESEGKLAEKQVVKCNERIPVDIIATRFISQSEKRQASQGNIVKFED
jgi:hypothetical protein